MCGLVQGAMRGPNAPEHQPTTREAASITVIPALPVVGLPYVRVVVPPLPIAGVQYISTVQRSIPTKPVEPRRPSDAAPGQGDILLMPQ